MHTDRRPEEAVMTSDLLVSTPPTMPVQEYRVRGGGGVVLHAREWGNPDGPAIVFVHGWSQCDLCWQAQVDSPLAARFRMVTFDLRGHGTSERPPAPGGYTDERLWADDLAAVLDQLAVERPVLVGWSYGGFVVGDYLRAYGEAAIAGIDLVGAAVRLSPPTFEHIGPGFLENAPEACVPDLGTNIAAVQRFLRRCTVRALPDELRDAALAWTMAVPPEVRGALITRQVDSDDVFRRLTVPVLVTHGRQDEIILPSMAEHVLDVCPPAVASWYDGVGHMPFVEDAGRFNRELTAFVERTGR
jgi:pimeloyl-ACP methyl ester carboxylesterase